LKYVEIILTYLNIFFVKLILFRDVICTMSKMNICSGCTKIVPYRLVIEAKGSLYTTPSSLKPLRNLFYREQNHDGLTLRRKSLGDVDLRLDQNIEIVHQNSLTALDNRG
jgi:hypothetical protein